MPYLAPNQGPDFGSGIITGILVAAAFAIGSYAYVQYEHDAYEFMPQPTPIGATDISAK
ncbi:MAG: hypothetical protein KDJ49_02980 [Alphaproteobacteria bacterium]|nr:hypothetical protein [Alphaproteobacteria bacterium]USO07435.1 MAG: hypothetical protein H6866_08460 [Rhodospirillales bacterium]